MTLRSYIGLPGDLSNNWLQLFLYRYTLALKVILKKKWQCLPVEKITQLLGLPVNLFVLLQILTY